jgi:hypothetical protein
MLPTINLLMLRIMVHLQAMSHGIEEADGKKHIAKYGKIKAHTKAMSDLNKQVKVGNAQINVDNEIDYGERHDREWEYDDDVTTTAHLAHSGFTLSDPLFNAAILSRPTISDMMPFLDTVLHSLYPMVFSTMISMLG